MLKFHWKHVIQLKWDEMTVRVGIIHEIAYFTTILETVINVCNNSPDGAVAGEEQV